MIFSPIPLIELSSLHPRKCGQQHGETLRKSIQEMAEIHFSLLFSQGGFCSKKEVMDLAGIHLAALAKEDEALYEEFLGICEASHTLPEKLLILNHYTGFRDLSPKVSSFVLGKTGSASGSSVLFMQTLHDVILGQTWDGHQSAMKHVVLLQIKQRYEKTDNDQAAIQEGRALLFSVAGCLGGMGMNDRGVGVCMSDLSSLDARVGLVWPAVMRKALREKTAHRAAQRIMQASASSGHHYAIADEKDYIGIEASGEKKKIIEEKKAPFTPSIHTNHFLDKEMGKTECIHPHSTTFDRYHRLHEILSQKPPCTSEDVYEALGKVALVSSQMALDAAVTCGAMVMNLTARKALACIGSPSIALYQNPPRQVDVSA